MSLGCHEQVFFQHSVMDCVIRIDTMAPNGRHHTCVAFEAGAHGRSRPTTDQTRPICSTDTAQRIQNTVLGKQIYDKVVLTTKMEKCSSTLLCS